MSSLQTDWFLHRGLRIRYARRPGKPGRLPLLMFNGMGQSLEAWEPLLAALPGTPIIAYDVPGAGLSDVPPRPWRYREHARLAAQLVHHLGSDRVNVFGLSWGGGLAQQFSHQFPDLGEKLILAAAVPGFLMFPGDFAAYSKMASLRRFSDRDHMAAIAGDIYGGDLRVDGSVIEQLSALQQLPPTEKGYSYQAQAMAGWTSLPFIWRLSQPTLILHGEDDPLVPAVNARIMAHLIPDCRLELIDCGHLFTLTRIDRISPLILDFLGGAPR